MFVEKIFDLNNFELDIFLIDTCIFCKKNISKKIQNKTNIDYEETNKKKIIYLSRNSKLNETIYSTIEVVNQQSIKKLKLFCNNRNYIVIDEKSL